MFKKPRVFFGVLIFFALVFSLPLPVTSRFKTALFSSLSGPVNFSQALARTAANIFHFSRNARELQSLRRAIGEIRIDTVRLEELHLENQRLTSLLGLKQASSVQGKHLIFARVVGSSPTAWNRVFLIDKGTKESIEVNRLVLSESSLVGKVVESGPHTAKVLLINDPNFRIGVRVQRTRQQGVLFGTLAGNCRIKYLSPQVEVRPEDVVETAGFGDLFPKGILIGKIEKVWKEPGQMYQVAELKPFIDFSRVEEVSCLDE